jgi:hypothetical protein
MRITQKEPEQVIVVPPPKQSEPTPAETEKPLAPVIPLFPHRKAA